MITIEQFLCVFFAMPLAITCTCDTDDQTFAMKMTQQLQLQHFLFQYQLDEYSMCSVLNEASQLGGQEARYSS